jgi:hypothetical protein
MAGLPHLFDISSKKGEEFINNLLSQYTIVSEKLDGSRFEFQKQDDGSILFYKRDPKNPITKVERTMMSVFEKPIDFIENLSDSTKKLFPTDFRFGFEFFVNKKPVATLYDRMPQNQLVLTDIKIIDSGGRPKKVITDTKILSKWARTLDVEAPPVIFAGKLNTRQRAELQDFILTPFADLTAKFKTTSFTRFIISIINPKLKKTALQNDLDKPIEGIVFKFVGGPKEEFSAKMVDPIFTANARAKRSSDAPRRTPDSTAIAILQMTEYMRIKGLGQYDLIQDDSELRYIELISAIFLDFMNDKKSIIDGFKFETPAFAQIPEFQVNTRFIKNDEALRMIKKSQLNHDVFKVLLGTFKKERKRPTPVIDKASMSEINAVIANIKRKISKEPTNESGKTLSFTEFLKQNG